MKAVLLGAALALFLVPSSSEAAKKGLCKFDTVTLEFSGSAAEQATCLLRFVKFKATGSTVQTVPDAISQRVWKTADVSLSQIRACMTKKGLLEADFGTSTATDAASKFKYFVIHDTSSPEFSTSAGFPANINDAAWSGNKIATGWGSIKDRVHFIVNRVGQSRVLTKLGASRAKPATKLEQNSQHSATRPYFVHVENIQPRLKPPGSWAHTSPDPGFSEKQLIRLAQLYVASSVVAGKWLIPAFHFNIDAELFAGVDVHDDPQKFDLPLWAKHVDTFITECKS